MGSEDPVGQEIADPFLWPAVRDQLRDEMEICDVAGEQEHHQVWKSPDRVRATNGPTLVERREARRRPEHILCAKLHFHEKGRPKASAGPLVSRSRLE